MFTDAIVKPTPGNSSPVLAEELRVLMELPGAPATVVPLVQDIFSKEYGFGDFLIGVESAQFLDRIRHSGAQLTIPDESSGAPTVTAPVAGGSINESSQIRYRWRLEYLPRRMQQGKLIFRNVRLENIGTTLLSSRQANPIRIAYHWRNALGEMVQYDGERTPLLIDLGPGRQMTQSIVIIPPQTPGRYLFELTLVHEGVGWLDEGSKTIPIEVTSGPPPTHTEGWNITELRSGDYDQDHRRAIEMTRQRLAKLHKPRPRILEVGGNAHPMILSFDGELYNTDVDVHGLQMAYLRWNFKQFCADANALPFADEFFDCIAVFASLHHFGDLSYTLRALARKLNPGGFIAIMCEPVGHAFSDTMSDMFRAELLRGVNEQCFSMEEYAQIFREANLRAEEVIVDEASLKAILTK
jgi:hypothetical protein